MVRRLLRRSPPTACADPLRRYTWHFARVERANLDAVLEWASATRPGARPADRERPRLGLGRSRRRRRRATRPSRARRGRRGAASAHERVLALLGLSWLEASAGDVAQGHAAVSEALDLLELGQLMRYLHAKGKWYLAYVLSQQGRFPESLALLEESRPMFRELGYDWEQAASWVLTAPLRGRSRRSVGGRSGVLARPSASSIVFPIRGCSFMPRRCSAQSRNPNTVSHDACEHLGRAARDAEQLGFAATEAYHLANLGRAQQQHGDLEAAADTLHRAIEAARATADLRVAALARTRLSRVLREQGRLDAARTTLQLARDWYHASGGGDGARLADYLAASMTSSSAPTKSSDSRRSSPTRASAEDMRSNCSTLDVLARVSADAGRSRHGPRPPRDRGQPYAGANITSSKAIESTPCTPRHLVGSPPRAWARRRAGSAACQGARSR